MTAAATFEFADAARPAAIGSAPRPIPDPLGGVEAHFAHRGHGAEFEMEAAWIQQRLPKHASRVLDVGCGSGSLFDWIGRSRVIGLDLCGEGLSLTRSRRPNVPLLVARGERLPLAGEALDAVTAQHVIEHIPDAERVLREWRRVLKVGGLLILLTPNACFCDPSVFADPTHVRIYDRLTLPATVQRSGLVVDELRTLGLPLFRNYRACPGGWRARRMVTRHAQAISSVAGLRWRGQTLCCVARRAIQ